MPLHILVRFPDDFLLGINSEIVKETLACSQESPVDILPEKHALRIQDDILPDDLIRHALFLPAGSSITQGGYHLLQVILPESRFNRNVHGPVEIRPLHRHDQMEEPVILTGCGDTPEQARERMIFVLLHTGPHGRNIRKFPEPVPIREITVLFLPGTNHRGNRFLFHPRSHRLI